MECRFELFNAFTLPSLGAMPSAHSHLLHIVLVSAEMPAIFRDRLHGLVDQRPWCRVLTLADSPSTWDHAGTLIGEEAGGDQDYTLRIDDDDALALSCSTISRLSWTIATHPTGRCSPSIPVSRSRHGMADLRLPMSNDPTSLSALARRHEVNRHGPSMNTGITRPSKAGHPGSCPANPGGARGNHGAVAAEATPSSSRAKKYSRTSRASGPAGAVHSHAPDGPMRRSFRGS